MPRLLNLILIPLLILLPAPVREASAQATDEPSREPVLRIETGMHTAIIWQIGMDTANRFLVTASDDKTVRVWEFPTGRLLRVIRVPLGAGHEGKLNAVALSPDGATIAAGGWTSPNGSNTNIYVFDRESGRLLRRLSGLPDKVLYLVYSPDGRYLAAVLGQGNGVRVYQTGDYSSVSEDSDYGDDSYSADFDRAGRLVTACLDGFIRLYAPAGEKSLRRVAKQKAAGGNLPFSVNFSPDGSHVAIGFADSTRLAVLSGHDLSLLYTPDTSGVNNGNLGRVAWSADGRTLYAGGGAQDANNRVFIRAWSGGGRGSYRDVAAAANTIFHILPLRLGGIAYGAGDPAFGALDAANTRVLFTSAALADYRALQQGFFLSPDGTGLGFAYELFGKSPARFSLADRRLGTTPVTGGVSWHLPTTKAAELRITDWYNTYEPKLNGARLKLVQNEMSRSLAIAPDASAFLLGTSFWLRLFERNGAERWKVAIPGEAWAVNISADGQLAVAAYADGTIRWYGMTDGRELLAFFPHADRKRWVVWTPSGYYDASPGAEELIGWHVNNGRDRAADFFPVGQFRNVYYRPDVVSKVLETRDEQLALRAANEEAGRKQQAADVSMLLPPVVEIVSPADGAELAADEVVVRFNVRTPSGEPVTEVKALVDGRPVATGRGLGLQATGQNAGTRELRFNVPAGESLVSIIAANRYTSSVPATVRVRARQPVAVSAAATPGRVASPARPAGEAFEIRPKLYVLAVGVSNYADPKLKLGFAAKDAQDFAVSWERQRGELYRDVVVKVLTDDRATKDEVLDGLDWIRKETTSKDVAVVLFAGHGVNDPNGLYYFLPFNADTNKLLRTGVSFSDIKNTVAALAGKTLFFIDTCHSGNVLGGARRGLLGSLGDLNGVVNELASAENGAVVFAASTGNQFSLEHAMWNNGAFTKAVVEGLGGGADYDKSGKGRITLNMLDLYISERVKELTKGQQTPTTAKPHTVPDFPIALKK
ncbi:MAG TPA: caspase family protein [Pyrinomonadaceae bacterium]|nr:caspase family protein [Pyrinomonadaceae bacterium]